MGKNGNAKFDFETFCEVFRLGLQKEMSKAGDFIIEKSTLKKVNGDKEALVIRKKGYNIAPAVYLTEQYDAYTNGMSVEVCIEKTVHDLKRTFLGLPAIPELSHDYIKENLYLVLINKDRNEELLRKTPHEIIGDIAVVPRIKIGPGSSVAGRGLVEKFGFNDEELMMSAHENMENRDYALMDLGNAMFALMGSDFDQEECTDVSGSVFVLTNEDKMDGASAMLSKNSSCGHRVQFVTLRPAE